MTVSLTLCVFVVVVGHSPAVRPACPVYPVVRLCSLQGGKHYQVISSVDESQVPSIVA